MRWGNTLIDFFDKNDQFEYSEIGRKGLPKFFDYDPAEKTLKNVEIFKTLKANGENAQISWNSTSESWVIASKNVSILAEKFQNLIQYPQDGRYFFAIKIAEQWFKILNSIKNLEKFKKELDGHTMIGEFVGNQNFQHLVKYARPTIIFYAVVENSSDDYCWHPAKSRQFFENFGLDSVPMSSIGKFEDPKKALEEVNL